MLFTAQAEYCGYSFIAFANSEFDAALVALGAAMSQSLAADAIQHLEGSTPSISSITDLTQLYAVCEQLCNDGLAVSVITRQLMPYKE